MVRTPRFTAESPGSIPGRGTKIPQAAWCGQKKKKKGGGPGRHLGCTYNLEGEITQVKS